MPFPKIARLEFQAPLFCVFQALALRAFQTLVVHMFGALANSCTSESMSHHSSKVGGPYVSRSHDSRVFQSLKICVHSTP